MTIYALTGKSGLAMLIFFAISGGAISQVTPSSLSFRDEVELTSLHLESNSFRTVADNDQFFVQTAPNKYVAVDLDGHTRTAIDTSLVPVTVAMSPKGMFLVDLSPVPGHGVVAPVGWMTDAPVGDADRTTPESHVGILSFDERGQYKDLIELGLALNIRRVAEFSSSGSYLVAGYDNQGNSKLLLLDHAGNIKPAPALPWFEKKEAEGAKSGGSAQERMDNAAVAAAQVQMVSGEDNAVYVYNAAWGARIIRIRPDGFFSEIKLSGESQNAFSALLLAMFVAHGNIYLDEAAFPTDKQELTNGIRNFVLRIYDATDGTEKKSYRVDKGFGGSPVSLGTGIVYFLDARVLNGAVKFFLVSMSA